MKGNKTLAQKFTESFLKTNQDVEKQLKEIVFNFENVQILTIPASCVEYFDFQIEEKDYVDEQKLCFSLNKHKKQFDNKYFNKTNENEVVLSKLVLQLNEDEMFKNGIKEKDIEMIYKYPDLVSVELIYKDKKQVENQDYKKNVVFKLYLPYQTEKDWFGENQFSAYQFNLKTKCSFSDEEDDKLKQNCKFLTIYADKKVEVNESYKLKKEFFDLKNEFEEDKIKEHLDLEYLEGCLMMIKHSHKK